MGTREWLTAYLTIGTLLLVLVYYMIRAFLEDDEDDGKSEVLDKTGEIQERVDVLLNQIRDLVEEHEGEKSKFDEFQEVERKGKVAIFRKTSPRNILSEDSDIIFEEDEKVEEDIRELEALSKEIHKVTQDNVRKRKGKVESPARSGGKTRRKKRPPGKSSRTPKEKAPRKKKKSTKSRTSGKPKKMDVVDDKEPPKKKKIAHKKTRSGQLKDSPWNERFDSEFRLLRKRGFTDATPKKNVNSNYYCGISEKKPWERFHYRCFYSAPERVLVSYVYFGPCLLGPGTVHGGALASLTQELMFIFAKKAGYFPKKANFLSTTNCLFVEKVILEKVYKVVCCLERTKKGNTVYEISACLKEEIEDKRYLFINRGDFVKKFRDLGQLRARMKRFSHTRKELVGLDGMKRSFLRLVKKDGFDHVPNYREKHKYLRVWNHLLNYDLDPSGGGISNYFNFKCLIRNGLESQFLVFFGKKTESEYPGVVHDAAVVTAFDGLCGLSCVLHGYPEVKTNTMSVHFCEGEKLETLRPYRMIVQDKILNKDLIRERNLIRTKHSVSAIIEGLEDDRNGTIARFNGTFIDYKVLINGN